MKGMTATTVACTIGAVGAGIMAGLLFAFSSFVMRALDTLEADAAVQAMQQINKKIINPLFVLVFAGVAVVSVYLMIAGVDDSTPADRAARLASVFYLLGVIVVTMTQNIPLNNRLDKVAPDSDDSATVWPWYLTRWNRWNHVRTFAAVVASVCFALALIL